MIHTLRRLLQSNRDAFVNVCISVYMRGHVHNDMHLFQGVLSEPQATTLAVNYIMPFNSSTPKIDGYYNSSILATAKNSAGISQERRLSSV